MEFRDVAGLRVQRPSIDRDELTPEPGALKGDFDLDEVEISGGAHAHANVIGEGSMSHSVLTAVDMSESRLAPLSLSDVTFDNVNLSNAVLGETTARRVELIRCRAIGVQLVVVLASDLYVEACQFDYAMVRVERVKGAVVFSGCSFRETVFVGDLSSIVFADCEFDEAEFEATRAADCDLRGSRLTGVRGLLTMRGARITNDQALSVAAAIATESGLVVS